MRCISAVSGEWLREIFSVKKCEKVTGYFLDGELRGEIFSVKKHEKVTGYFLDEYQNVS
jgi:hypothetical protein